MRLVSRVTIAASPDRVWPFVANPELMARWNPKLIASDRTRTGPVSRLERYSLVYRMSGGETEHEAEVIDCEPPTRLSIRLRAPTRRHPSAVSAVETYELRDVADGTLLIQRLEIPIPLLLRPPIWFVHRFGTPTDTPYLERLKRLVESGSTSPA